jgi:hypothetical protein
MTTYRTVRKGDDVPFTLKFLTDQRPGEDPDPIPTAEVSWQVLDDDTGELVEDGEGNMDVYDGVNAHFKSKLPKALTSTLVEKRKYALVMIVVYDGDEASFTILFSAEARTEATLH